MNDPRCVPGLIEAAAQPRSGFASNSAHHPAADWHHAVLPALHEVVGHLPDHAELLLPMICGRLDAAAEDHVLSSYCNVLADWGPAAEPAVPQLLALLGDDRAWTAAATAPAGIGTPGTGRGNSCRLVRAPAGHTPNSRPGPAGKSVANPARSSKRWAGPSPRTASPALPCAYSPTWARTPHATRNRCGR
ncbi:hypothetical protein [Streptomyces sp. IBSNAI001]|uniref:hypothetical protein n=1 Tax=Streptomyces sp. IBSNAI001 TaxID=3457499 RepID=UPI003FD51459